MSVHANSFTGSAPDARSRTSEMHTESRHSTQDRSQMRSNSIHSTPTSGSQMAKNQNEGDLLGRRAIIFTGPDGIRPHRMSVNVQQHVGEASRKSNETTCALSYLFRGPAGMPFPKAKNGQINETGWEVENLGTGYFT